jgi:hypothetical protein
LADQWRKKFKVQKFKHVTVGGFYEHKLKPWMITFLVGFKIKTTPLAKDYFPNQNDMLRNLANNHISLRKLDRAVEAFVLPGWQWNGVRYSYNHNPKQIDFDRQSPFQFDAFMIADPAYEQNRDYKTMQWAFKFYATHIAAMDELQTNEFFEFTPTKSVK